MVIGDAERRYVGGMRSAGGAGSWVLAGVNAPLGAATGAPGVGPIEQVEIGGARRGCLVYPRTDARNGAQICGLRRARELSMLD